MRLQRAELLGKIRVGARSDFAKSGLLVFLALNFASALNYGFYLVIGHRLTVAAFGAVISLISVFSLATTPAAIGQTILAKLVAQRAVVRRVPRDITRRTAAVGLATGLAIVAAGWLWRISIAGYLRLEHSEYVVITAVMTALGVLLFLGRGLLQGAQLFRAFAVSNVLDGLLRFGLAFVLVTRFGVDGALLAIVLAVAIAVAYGALVSIRATASGSERSETVKTAQASSTVFATGAISFAMIGLGFYDPILVKHYLAPTDAGVYGVLSLAGRTVAIVLSFVPIILLPQVTERTVSGHSSRSMLAAALALSIAVAICATALCAAGASFVVRILAGPAFAAATPLVAMYVAAASLLAIANVLAAYLMGKHDYRVVLPLFAAAAAELAAVVYRHGTVLAVVQDVLAGHTLVACVLLVAVLARLARFGDAQPAHVAA